MSESKMRVERTGSLLVAFPTAAYAGSADLWECGICHLPLLSEELRSHLQSHVDELTARLNRAVL